MSILIGERRRNRHLKQLEEKKSRRETSTQRKHHVCRNWLKTKKQSISTGYDPVLLDEVKFEQDGYIRVHRSRRNVYYVHPSTFPHLVLAQLEQKKYTPIYNTHLSEYFDVIRGRRRNRKTKKRCHSPYTHHKLPYSILVEIVVVSQHKDSKSILVDIAGVKTKGDDTPSYRKNSKLSKWVDYIQHVNLDEYVGCCNSACLDFFYKDETTQHIVTCTSCQTTQCTNCSVDMKAHGDQTCREYQQQVEIKKLDDPFVIASLFNGTTQSCPSCSTFVHKTEGCNKMICDCGAYWCWACGLCDLRDLYRDPYDHYKDDEKAHVGIDGSQTKCPAGGEFTENIEQMVIDRNITMFPDLHRRYLDEPDPTS